MVWVWKTCRTQKSVLWMPGVCAWYFLLVIFNRCTLMGSVIFLQKFFFKIPNWEPEWDIPQSWHPLPHSWCLTHKLSENYTCNLLWNVNKVIMNKPNKICGRQSSNFLRAVFHKFYLVDSWIFRSIQHSLSPKHLFLSK